MSNDGKVQAASSPKEQLKDNAIALASYSNGLRKFDKAFLDKMAEGVDFTIRLEIHGNKGEILHTRVYLDDIDRPVGAEKRINTKS